MGIDSDGEEGHTQSVTYSSRSDTSGSKGDNVAHHSAQPQTDVAYEQHGVITYDCKQLDDEDNITTMVTANGTNRDESRCNPAPAHILWYPAECHFN